MKSEVSKLLESYTTGYLLTNLNCTCTCCLVLCARYVNRLRKGKGPTGEVCSTSLMIVYLLGDSVTLLLAKQNAGRRVCIQAIEAANLGMRDVASRLKNRPSISNAD